MVRNHVNLASADVADQHRKFSPIDRLLAGKGEVQASAEQNRYIPGDRFNE